MAGTALPAGRDMGEGFEGDAAAEAALAVGEGAEFVCFVGVVEAAEAADKERADGGDGAEDEDGPHFGAGVRE